MSSWVTEDENDDDSIIFEEDEIDDDDDNVDGWGDDDDCLIFDDETTTTTDNKDETDIDVPVQVEQTNGLIIDRDDSSYASAVQLDEEQVIVQVQITAPEIPTITPSDNFNINDSITTNTDADTTGSICNTASSITKKTFGWLPSAATATTNIPKLASTSSDSTATSNGIRKEVGNADIVHVTTTETINSSSTSVNSTELLSSDAVESNSVQKTNSSSDFSTNNNNNSNVTNGGSIHSNGDVNGASHQQQQYASKLRTPARKSKMASPKSFLKPKQQPISTNDGSVGSRPSTSTLTIPILNNNTNSMPSKIKDSTNIITVKTATTIVSASKENGSSPIKVKDERMSVPVQPAGPGSDSPASTQTTPEQSLLNVDTTAVLNISDNTNEIATSRTVLFSQKDESTTASSSSPSNTNVSPSAVSNLGSIWQRLAATVAPSPVASPEVHSSIPEAWDDNEAEDDDGDDNHDDDVNEWDDDILDFDETTNNDEIDNDNEKSPDASTAFVYNLEKSALIDPMNAAETPVRQNRQPILDHSNDMSHSDVNPLNSSMMEPDQPKMLLQTVDAITIPHLALPSPEHVDGFTDNRNEPEDDLMQQLQVVPVDYQGGLTNGNLCESVALKELQTHFHKQLQLQYELVEQKNKQIQDLRQVNSTCLNEKFVLQEEIAKYVHHVIPSLQTELLAIASERDVLKDDVVETNQGLETFRSLQNEIQQKHKQKVESIMKDAELVQSQILHEKEEALAAMEKNHMMELESERSRLADEKNDLVKREMLATMEMNHKMELESLRNILADEKNDLVEQLHSSQEALRRHKIETEEAVSSTNVTIDNQEREIQLMQHSLADIEHQIQRIVGRATAVHRKNEQSSGEGTEGWTSNGSYNSTTNSTITALVQKLDTQLSSKDEEIQRLEDVIENMTFHEETHVDDVSELRTSNELLNEENLALREQIRVLDHDCQSMKTSNDQLTTAIAQSELRDGDRIQEIEQLQHALHEQSTDFHSRIEQFENAKANEIASLTNELQEVQNILMMKSNENDSLCAQLNSLSHDNHDLNLKLQEALNNTEIAVRDAKAEHQKSLKHLVDLGKELKHMQEQSNGSVQKVNELEQHVSILTTERDDALAKYEDLWNKHEDLAYLHSLATDEVDVVRQQLLETNKDLEMKLLLMSQNYDALQLSMSGSGAKENEMKQTIDSLRREMIQMNKDHASVVSNYESARSRLVQESESLLATTRQEISDQIRKVQNENDELYVQFARMNMKYEQAIADAEQQKQTENATQSNLNDVNNQNRELMALAESLIEERDDLLKLVTNLHVSSDKNSNITTDLVSTKNELHQLQVEYQKLQGEMSNLQQQLQQQQMDRTIGNGKEKEDAMQISVETTNLAVHDLQQKCGQFQSEIQLLHKSNQTAVSDLQVQIESLTNKVTVSERELADTKGMITMKDEQITKLSTERDTIQSQIVSLQAEIELKKNATAIGTETDVDSLRTYVYTLAKSLETSEKKHAQAVEALVTERALYAERVQKLSMNMKQYYSSVSLLSNSASSTPTATKLSDI